MYLAGTGKLVQLLGNTFHCFVVIVAKAFYNEFKDGIGELDVSDQLDTPYETYLR